jgi:hypothetical protein
LFCCLWRTALEKRAKKSRTTSTDLR